MNPDSRKDRMSPPETLTKFPDPDRAGGVMTASRPRVPEFHLFDSAGEPQILLADGTRIYGISREIKFRLEELMASQDPVSLGDYLESLGLESGHRIDNIPLTDPPLHAISLAIAQKCNLGCNYCYAQQGQFGQAARNMPFTVAREAVDLLLKDKRRGDRINLAFLGGEPLINRPVLRDITLYAKEKADRLGLQIGFSITSNGTLITPDDGIFFETFGFAVTVSLDGVGAAHDQQRSFKGGKGSYEKIIGNIRPLLASQKNMQVSARVTVTARNLDLLETLEHFVGLGFHSVGFSPMLSSPGGRDEMDAGSLKTMLEQMIACGEAFETRVVSGTRFPFSNIVIALREIHKGTHRPYPCGAGAGYLGVSAGGELAACHRFVGDSEGSMGTLSQGIDSTLRNHWLNTRHVHRQEPCKSCWARYLCGGGCHHEVIRRGRPACDYIRGWLHYCLQAYTRIRETRPDYFSHASYSSI
jgi:uncharacterized protein